MSFCNYVSNFVVLPRNFEGDFTEYFDFDRYSSQVQTDVDDFFPLEDNEILLSFDNCRETLVDFIEEFIGEAEYREKRRCVFGVRCFGSLYHRLAVFLSANESRPNILQEFILKVTGLRCIIKSGFMPSNNIFNGHTQIAFEYRDMQNNRKTMPNNGYIEIYFESRHVFNVDFSTKVSAILGLLRERRIYRKILSGIISTRLQLTKEFIKLGFERMQEKPTGMLCLEAMGPLRDKNLQEIVESSIDFTSEMDNGEGSGCADTLATGVFWHVPLSDIVGHYYSGPVDVAETLVTQMPTEKLKALFPKKYLKQIEYGWANNFEWDSNLFRMLKEVYIDT